MKKKLLVVSFLITGMMACSKSDDKTQSSSRTLLPSEKFSLESAPDLTAEQVAFLKSQAGKSEVLTLSQNLIAHPYDSEDSENKRKKELDQASEDQKKVLEEMKTHCLISDSIPVIKGASENTGDIRTESSEASINGPACNVDFSQASVSTSTILNSNLAELKKEYAATSDRDVFKKLAITTSNDSVSEEKMLVLAKDLIESTQIKSSLIRSLTHFESVYANGATQSQLLTATSTGSLELASGEKVTIDSKFEGAGKEALDDATYSRRLTFPSFKVIVQMLKSKAGKAYYLNGKPTDTEKLKELGFVVSLD